MLGDDESLVPREYARRVLVVEDDSAVARLLVELLSAAGYAVRTAATLAVAHAFLREWTPDLVLLDLVLPDGNGLQLCARAGHGGLPPVVVCSARATPATRVQALRLGADDVIAKPFDADELLARVHAVLRRARRPAATPREAETGPVRVGPLTFDASRRELGHHGATLVLRPAEFSVLAHFVAHPGVVVSASQLAREALHVDPDSAARNSVETTLRRLRARLARAGLPPLLETVRGFGYRVVARDE